MESETRFEVIWSNAALNDIAGIDNFIALANPDAADRIVGRIVERTALLSAFPKMGRPYVQTRSCLIRSSVVESYRILYTIDEEARKIEITHIWHGSRLDPDFD
jgi:plasmid stabilization system protein ParE